MPLVLAASIELGDKQQPAARGGSDLAGQLPDPTLELGRVEGPQVPGGICRRGGGRVRPASGDRRPLRSGDEHVFEASW